MEELGRHDRADVGAHRVHELQDDDASTERVERHGSSALVGEREVRGLVRTEIRAGHRTARVRQRGVRTLRAPEDERDRSSDDHPNEHPDADRTAEAVRSAGAGAATARRRRVIRRLQRPRNGVMPAVTCRHFAVR